MSDSTKPPAMTFGRFVVDDLLGRGGMGVVYRAHDPVIGRQVAIKVLQLEASDSTENTELRSRFEQEFRSAGTLSHPNLVTVYDVGEENGCAYIAMECVEGESLEQVIRSGRELSFKRVSEIAIELCDGLDYAHAAGIVHRDVKPANVLLTPDGRPKITDFGVAKVLSSNLTQTGTVVGTPSYMAPEQVTGEGVSGASDQFAAAVIFYQMLTGELPFKGDIPTTVLYKIVHEQPTPPNEVNPELPSAIDSALMRGLSKKPEDRYPSCRALAEAVREALGATPTVPEESHHRTVTLSGEALPTGSGTYDGAMSWWRRRSGGPRIGLMTAGAVLVAVLGWQSVATYLERTGAAGGGRLGALIAQLTSKGQEDQDTEGGAANSGASGPAGGDVRVSPPPPVVETFRMESDPPGATVTVDGKAVPGTTPLEIPLTHGQTYDIVISKEGYVPEGSRGLDPATRDEPRLLFQLRPRVVPGTLVVQAGYEVLLEVDGKRLSGSPASLAPGRYRVRLIAPAVFHERTRTIEIRSGEESTVRMPATVSVRLISVPSNATVTVDDQRSFSTPNDLSMVQGDTHRFRFEWPDGKKLERTIPIGRTVRRIIGSPTEIRAGN